ncbi:chemotaxis protein CheB [Dyadobacter chenhuakuii]|uniref:protein-glutamate methylesterase n=1 Tax=Dyadobacter chenhuakuii TaxID=2909339 RepID=A0A9X1Q9T6_9BACT|nr:chemotaxis protein CheB [Dyadobacter chenhuakuii]MCF2497525.1 chemotaxis protein CheB [Dyadobacter chenhuakuii]
MEESDVKKPVKALLIGGSAGSLQVLFHLLPLLNKTLPFAIIVVLHRRHSADSSLSELLSTKTALPTHEVDDKDVILPGHIYLAPADYHLLIEKGETFSLDYSEKVNFSRPSIDVTFESAAEVYGSSLAALLLSGANEDGTKGLLAVKKTGGITLVQNPETAQMPYMPNYALAHAVIDHVCDIAQMAHFINTLH